MTRLRDRAESLKKRAEKSSSPRLRGKSVQIVLSHERFKLVKKLAYARDYNAYRSYKDLLQDIVSRYFDDNRDGIAREIEAWTAKISQGRKGASAALKQEKLRKEALMAEPARKAIGELMYELRKQTGSSKTFEYLHQHLKNEFGHAKTLHEVPIPFLDDLLAKIKQQGDPAAQVLFLESLAARTKSSEPQK